MKTQITKPERKHPSYKDILKAIQDCKTPQQLKKIKKQVINFAGSPHEVTSLYTEYNHKNI